jgi:Bacterial regulatory helix-turn-helix protein, lysR family
MRNLSLKQLQAVAAVARLGTMTRAAQELNVTSAALYARIRQLEEEAGLLLFDRTPGGLKPTDAGREMLWGPARTACGRSAAPRAGAWRSASSPPPSISPRR